MENQNTVVVIIGGKKYPAVFGDDQGLGDAERAKLFELRSAHYSKFPGFVQKHSPVCGRVFNKYDLGCPRCRQLTK